jgi:hypothetical protein
MKSGHALAMVRGSCIRGRAHGVRRLRNQRYRRARRRLVGRQRCTGRHRCWHRRTKPARRRGDRRVVLRHGMLGERSVLHRRDLGVQGTCVVPVAGLRVRWARGLRRRPVLLRKRRPGRQSVPDELREPGVPRRCRLPGRDAEVLPEGVHAYVQRLPDRLLASVLRSVVRFAADGLASSAVRREWMW